jgi:hypothetical protein
MLRVKLFSKILTLFMLFGLFFSINFNIAFAAENECDKHDPNPFTAFWGGLKCIGSNTASAAVDVGISTVTNLIGPLVKWIITQLFWILNIFLEWVLYIVGWFVDWILKVTVLEYKTWFYDMGGSGKDNIIYTMWAFIRDILNTVVFFVMMYHAIRSMIEGFEEIKSKFIYLLVFALLVNFSLLFVKVVIDTSNIVTLTIYQSAIPQIKNEEFGNGSFTSYSLRQGTESEEAKQALLKDPTTLTGYIIKQLNPAERWSKKSGDAINQADTQTLKNNEAAVVGSAFYQIGYFISLGYLIYIFLLIGSTFLVRAAAFIAAMILSPLLVANFFHGSERIKNTTDQVKATLIDYSLRGPLYIFIVLLASTFARAAFAKGLNPSQSFDYNFYEKGYLALQEMLLPVAHAQSLTLIQVEAHMFLRFLLFIAIMELLRRLVDTMIDSVTHGSAFMGSWAGSMAKIGGKGLIRTTALAGRLTGGNIGKALVATDENSWLNIGGRISKMQQSRNGLVRTVGRTIGWTGKKMYDGTWDAGNAWGVKKLSSKAGIEFGGSKIKASEQGKKILGAYENVSGWFTKGRLDTAANTGRGRKVEASDISDKETEKYRTSYIRSRETEMNTIGQQIENATRDSSRTISEELRKIRDDDHRYIAEGNISNETIQQLQSVISTGVAKEIGGVHFTAETAKQVVDIQTLKKNAEAEVKQLIAAKAQADKAAQEMREKNKESIKSDIASSKNKRVEDRIKGAVKKAEEDSEKAGVVTQAVVAGIGTGSGVKMKDVSKARKAALSKIQSSKIQDTYEKQFEERLRSTFLEEGFEMNTMLKDIMDMQEGAIKQAIEAGNTALRDKILSIDSSHKTTLSRLQDNLKTQLKKGEKADKKEVERIAAEITKTHRAVSSAVRVAITEAISTETNSASRAGLAGLRKSLTETGGKVYSGADAILKKTEKKIEESARASGKAAAKAEKKDDH